MSKNKSYTKTGTGRVATNGTPKSQYNPKVIPGYCITYSEQDRLVRENGYKTSVVKELMKDRQAFVDSYKQEQVAVQAEA